MGIYVIMKELKQSKMYQHWKIIYSFEFSLRSFTAKKQKNYFL